MTKKLYLNESYRKEYEATVLSCVNEAGDQVKVICDETIFYPQGGGQPTDIGTMASPNTSCQVTAVSYDRTTGEVTHSGSIVGSAFSSGDRVRMEIDWPTRYHHMRLHSGGHLIDHAIQFLAVPFQATKANHFPSGPSVEFKVLDTERFPVDKPSLDAFKESLQAKCDEVLAMNCKIVTLYQEDGVAETHEEKLKAVKEPIRLILFEGCPAAVPCGGTHVAYTSEIGQRVLIKKLTYKDQLLRISYKIE